MNIVKKCDQKSSTRTVGSLGASIVKLCMPFLLRGQHPSRSPCTLMTFYMASSSFGRSLFRQKWTLAAHKHCKLGNSSINPGVHLLSWADIPQMDWMSFLQMAVGKFRNDSKNSPNTWFRYFSVDNLDTG